METRALGREVSCAGLKITVDEKQIRNESYIRITAKAVKAIHTRVDERPRRRSDRSIVHCEPIRASTWLIRISLLVVSVQLECLRASGSIPLHAMLQPEGSAIAPPFEYSLEQSVKSIPIR